MQLYNKYFFLFSLVMELLDHITVVSLKVPPSFSTNQKSYVINNNNITHITILELLSKLEIDFHLNVILLGEIFDDKSIKILSESTSKLSKTAALYYPYNHLYEKILFHFSVDKGLEKRLRQLSSPGDSIGDEWYLRDSINDLLNKYEDNDSLSTTLFIFHDLLLQPDSQLPSAKCGIATEISLRSNFAWIDLSSESSELSPQFTEQPSNMMNYPKFDIEDDNKWHKLSSIIFHSAESLNPIPFSYNNKKNDVLPKQVDILILNICMDIVNIDHDDSLACISDDSYINSVKVLSNSYSSSTTKIGYTSISIMLSRDPSLLYDIYKSIISDNINNEIIVSSKELLYWVMSNRIIKSEISKVAVSKSDNTRRLIPIIYIQNIDSLYSYYIDKLSNLVSIGNMNLAFDHHWGQSIDEDNININDFNNDLLWPTDSLIVVNNKKDINKLMSIGLECDDNIFFSSITTFIDYELFFNLRSVIWPMIPHPKHYYNSISKTLFESYLWYNTPTICNRKSENIIDNNCFITFREKRILKRYEFITKTEYILSNLYSAIKDAVVEVPDLNINKLFEVGNIKRMVQNKSSKLAKQVINKYKWRDDTKSIFEEFLLLIDEAITDFTHLYYDVSLLKLANVESYANILIDRLTDISQSKIQSLNCGLYSKETKSTLNFDTQFYHLFLYILITVSISGSLGYYYSSLKYSSVSKYRRF